jgi:hypothetical protein
MNLLPRSEIVPAHTLTLNQFTVRATNIFTYSKTFIFIDFQFGIERF